MSAQTPANCYHALDSLRGFAMFLGVLLHVAISFMSRPPAFWPVRDSEPTPLADVFLLAAHDFRMQLFFLLAGFFGCLLYQRYGTRRDAPPPDQASRDPVRPRRSCSSCQPCRPCCLYAEIENVRAVTVRGEPSALREYRRGNGRSTSLMQPMAG